MALSTPQVANAPGVSGAVLLALFAARGSIAQGVLSMGELVNCVVDRVGIGRLTLQTSQQAPVARFRNLNVVVVDPALSISGQYWTWQISQTDGHTYEFSFFLNSLGGGGAVTAVLTDPPSFAICDGAWDESGFDN